MDKTIYIYTGQCPGCGAQMPTPHVDLWTARYHPCPTCPPVSGRPKKWRVKRMDDKGGNIHFSYSDSRNGSGELTAQYQVRVSPALKARLASRSSEWVRQALELALDAGDNVI